jgi:hypothetical protein
MGHGDDTGGEDLMAQNFQRGVTEDTLLEVGFQAVVL